MSIHVQFIWRDRCPVCASQATRQLLSCPFTDGRVRGFLDTYYEGRVPASTLGGASFVVDECRECGLLFQREILSPPGMEMLYEHWISAGQSLDKKRYADLGLFLEYARQVAAIPRLCGRPPHEIRVLEYGAGWGHWLRMADAFGFDATGIELSRVRVQFARGKGLKIIEDLETQEDETFHYVYSNQTFEHLSHPLEVARELARVLAPGGVLYLQVPDGRRMRRWLADPAWKARKDALHPLEHINCYGRRSLVRLGEAVGLQRMAPPYQPEFTDLTRFLRSHLELVYDSLLGTRVFFRKPPGPSG